MKNLFTVLGLLSILFACTKEKEVSPFPIQMTLDNIEPISEMRLFIGGTELNPQYHEKTIEGFLDRYYSTTTNTGIINYQSRFAEPDIESYSKAFFTFNGNDDVRYAADIIEIKKLGDVTVMKSAVTNKTEEVPIVKSDLFKYKFDLNSNGTYNYQYVVYKGNTSLEVSLLYYKLVRYDDKGNRKHLAFGTVHNEFNEAFIETLTERDTLAVKEFRLKYSKK